MVKGRFQPQTRDTGKRLRVNDLIRISPILLVDENNEKAGVVDLDEAKRRAQAAGLDLVEVAPQSRPPVCRIMDYGKWKYQQKKKEQKARSHSKQSELKEVRLRPKIDIHDLNIKVDRARDFLDDGDKVQFTMIFRGREMAHQEIGLKTLQDICAKLDDASKVESEPRLMGRRITMILAPDKKAVQQPPRAPKPAAVPKSAATTPAPEAAPAPAPEAVTTPSAPDQEESEA